MTEQIKKFLLEGDEKKGKAEKAILLKGVEVAITDLATYSRLEEEANAKGDDTNRRIYNTRVEDIRLLLIAFIKDLLEEREGE